MRETTCRTTTRRTSRLRVIQDQNAALKQFFAQQGLRLSEVWTETPDNPEIENRQLLDLSQWVCLYGVCPNREKLEAKGLHRPPIHPDFDPETDWLRFERWIHGLPLTWVLPDKVSQCDDPENLDEAEVRNKLCEIKTYLAKRNVIIDLQPGVPDRLALLHLLLRTRDRPFQFVSSKKPTHLTGCDGHCDACFQKPWCDIATEAYWSRGTNSCEMGGKGFGT